VPMRLRGLLLLGALAARSAVAQAPADGLVSAVERYEKLQVAGEAARADNLRLASGHLACLLSSGSIAYVKAGDEIVGVFFQGNGSVEYVTENPIEFPVATFVAKKNTGLSPEKTDRGLRFRDRFTTLLWLVSGEAVPKLEGLAPLSLASAFQAHREKTLRKRGERLSVSVVRGRLAAPNAPLYWVEMEGGASGLLYRRGGDFNPAERLDFLHDSTSGEAVFKDATYAVPLSVQPVGRDPRDPPAPRFVLTDVDMELHASDDKDVRMVVVETVVPQREPLKVFTFDLDATVYTTFGAHVTTRSEHVRRVSDGQGRALPYVHANDELVVEVPEAAPADQPVKLRFEIDGDFLVHPGGSNFWELGVWSWFPQPRLGEQYYTFHALVRVKKPFVPFAPGKTIRRAEEGDENVVETKVDVPVQFAVVLAGDYSFKEENRDGLIIRVATYALKNERAIKQLTDLSATIIKFYQEFLGPFPFPEFNILEIDSYGFGQAPPGVMFITKEAFNPLGGTEENQIYSGGVNERFAHEIAHQYWGHVVKMPSHEEQWLTESFAEYSAALFMKAGKGDAEYKSIVSHWKPGANLATEKAPIPLANRVYDPSERRIQNAIRTGLLYEKGPLLLSALHKELGDQQFLTFLKSYQKSFRWKFGSTKTIASFLQFMTKKDYMPFFEQYYWGTGMPKE
jgi:hypothetical protein